MKFDLTTKEGMGKVVNWENIIEVWQYYFIILLLINFLIFFHLKT